MRGCTGKEGGGGSVQTPLSPIPPHPLYSNLLNSHSNFYNWKNPLGSPSVSNSLTLILLTPQPTPEFFLDPHMIFSCMWKWLEIYLPLVLNTVAAILCNFWRSSIIWCSHLSILLNKFLLVRSNSYTCICIKYYVPMKIFQGLLNLVWY